MSRGGTPVVVVVILVLLWIAILSPVLYRRWRERQADGSIESFHRELRLLQRSGSRLAGSVVRIETARSRNGLAPNQSGYPAVSSTPGRPSLVLLPSPGEEGGDAPASSAMPGVCEPSRAEVAGAGSTVHGAPARTARQVAYRPRARHDDLRAASSFRRGGSFDRGRARRQRLGAGLGAVCLVTAIGGMQRSLHPLWAVTAVSGLALLGFSGLVAYAQALNDAERTHGQSRSVSAVGGRSFANRRHVPASSWDRGYVGLAMTGEHGGYAEGWRRRDRGLAVPTGYEGDDFYDDADLHAYDEIGQYSDDGAYLGGWVYPAEGYEDEVYGGYGAQAAAGR